MKILDTHIHFWNYHPVKDAWITDDMKVIQRDFLGEDFKKNLTSEDEIFAIAVQADQSLAENELLLQEAQTHSFIKGIIGWVDLESEDLENQLKEYAKNSIIKGFRHIAQAEPIGFLVQKKIMSGIERLGKYNFTYDILVFPHQLKDAIELVKRLPNQQFILDHAAKPDLKTFKNQEWEKDIQEIALLPNVVCKISGLITEADWKNWKVEDIEKPLDFLVKNFGKNRLIFGSDWPVMLLAGDYQQWIDIIKNYTKDWTIEEKENFFFGTAKKTYKI